MKRQLKEFFKEVTEREASATKEAVKDVKEVVEGLGIRKEIICENDSNAEEKDVATNKEVLAEEATKDVGTVEKESILEDETKEIWAVDSQEGGLSLEAARGEEIAKGEEKIAAIKESSKEVIEKNGEEAFDQSVAEATEEAVKVIEETGEKVLKEQIVKDDAECIAQVEIQRDL